MQTLYAISVAIHVLSAIVWVGGVLFLGLVAVPATRTMAPQARRALIGRLGRAFRPVGWTALGLLGATAVVLLIRWGATWESLADLSFFAAPHTRLLGYKLVAVALMVVVSGVHDWWLGPLAEAATGRAAQEKHRRWASLLGRLTAFLVLVIVLLAVFVARPYAL